jgi:ELAV like protein 2/3/4
MDRSNLIVNYLPSGYTEKDLEDMFGSFGEILSIKIVRDKTTGISMGFGFVNYESNAAAQAALTALNGKKLRDDKIMKVSVARPAWKANIHSNLYIAGFPTSFSESDVMDLLGVHSTSAENVRLLRDPNKNPRGAAVVRMSSEESATGVISSLDGVPMRGVVGGQILQVRPWRPEFRPDRISDQDIAQNFRGFSKPASFNKPRYSAPQITSKSTNIKANEMLQRIAKKDTSPSTNRTGGFGLPRTATIDRDGNEIVGGVGSEDEEQQLFVLFVYHLPSTVSEDYLMDVFSQYGGEIESIRVMQGKGYGFISYYNEKDAIYAMTKLNGQSVAGSGRGIQIELKTEYV